ncbi:hypothetical protein HNS34_08050 [Rhodophyticola sp. DY48A3-103]|nr:hypothetical protein [Alterinioella nitratireducens]
MKTFKTASTAAENALVPFCLAPGTDPTIRPLPRETEHGIISTGGNHGDDCWGGPHAPVKRIRAALGEELFDRYSKIAMVRNPFDKTVSAFFWRSKGHDVVLDISGLSRSQLVSKFREFVQTTGGDIRTRPGFHVDYEATHLGNQQVIDHWVRSEFLEDDMRRVCASCSMEPMELRVGKSKTASRSGDRMPIADWYDRSTADIVRNELGWMFAAGGYSLDPDDASRVLST